MKVSVCIATYNQEKFIGKAIESALMQQTNFPFEILVGDDYSTDGTRAIVQTYIDRHPGVVKPVFHPRNLGQNGLFNAMETFRQGTGTYLASFDGDDYWTDPLKLQKQVDFLDTHPDFVACYHNALITYEDGSPSHVLNPPDQPTVSTLDDLIGEEEIWFMATSSVLFRNVLHTYPAWFMRSVSGDIPRYILLGRHGKFGYLPDVMSVYRKNQNGTSFTDKYHDAAFLLNRIDMYEGINESTDYQYNKTLRRNIARYYKMILESHQYQGHYWKSLPVALKYLRLGQPTGEARKLLFQHHIIPPPMMKLYSAIAIRAGKALR
jgi:glycosyltransferase involved in cell wall biosynthesis